MLGNDFHSSFCKRALILLTLFNLTAKKKELMERKVECGNHLHNIVFVMENVNGVALNYTSHLVVHFCRYMTGGTVT